MEIKRLFILFFLVCTLPVLAQRNNAPALADQYFQDHAYDKAADLYERLFENTRQPYFYQQYLSCLINLDELDKAEKFVKKQIKKFPKALTFRVDLGRVYKKTGEEQKAGKEFKDALDNLTENQYQVSELAQAFRNAGELDYAIATYLKGRKIFRNESIFYNELTRLYREKGDKQSLLNEYLDVLTQRPELLEIIEAELSGMLVEKEDQDLLKSLLLKRIQKYPDNISYTELLIWQLIQQREFDAALFQSIAMDKRLREDGRRVMNLARVCVSNQRYDAAIKAYEYLVAKGKNEYIYMDARLELLSTQRAKVISSQYTPADLQKLEADYLSFLNEFGRNASTAFAIRELGNLQALYMNKVEEAIQLFEILLEMKGLTNSFLAQCKLDLVDIYLLGDQGWEATLLYGQVDKAFKDEPLGQEAKFRNARLSYYRGEFDWAKAQLNVLKGSTSQLFSNDALNLSLLIADNTGLDSTTEALALYSKAELLIFQNKFSEAQALFDSINRAFPDHSLTDEIWMAQAKIFIRQTKYEQAIAEFGKVLDSYADDIWGDDALFMSADLYENKLDNATKAMEFYERLLNNYPGSLYVVEARKRFRVLRGDVIN